MPLSVITIHNLRNLKEVEFAVGPGLNFFYGENGAGKTTVLEAISFLGLGRSFKSRKHQPLIKHGCENLTIHCRLAGEEQVASIGVLRARQARLSRTHADGNNVTNTSTLAAQLPIQWIDTRSLELLGGPPALRRGFLDWFLFHVKHQFREVFHNYHQTLKHRNALLRRDKIPDRRELSLWTEQLSVYGDALDQLRSEFIQELKDVLLEPGYISEYKIVKDLVLSYSSGWDKRVSFAEALSASAEHDVHKGYTGLGPHKADIGFRVAGRELAEILSRGQTKTFVYSLYMAQIAAVQRQTARKVILLMDDFPAELDTSNRKKITEEVQSLATQVFVTGIEKQALMFGWSETNLDQAKVFHVKHGGLEEDQTKSGEVNDRQ